MSVFRRLCLKHCLPHLRSLHVGLLLLLVKPLANAHIEHARLIRQLPLGQSAVLLADFGRKRLVRPETRPRHHAGSEGRFLEGHLCLPVLVEVDELFGQVRDLFRPKE